MLNIYSEFKQWAKENSKWFMNTKDWFKFETENKSFYVFPADNGDTIEIETYEKGGSFEVQVETYLQFLGLSITLKKWRTNNEKRNSRSIE